MEPITVVGSGASGVHFARTLLDRGHAVELIDVGATGERPPLPDATLSEFKRAVEEPVESFLGEDLESLTLPGADGEYYGFPPNKGFVFEDPGVGATRSDGFAPLASFAAGGLAEAWTAGVYPFSDDDLADFPFGLERLLPAYAEVAARIGVTGEPDDLDRFMPLHDHLLEPLELDRHSHLLYGRYGRVRERWHGSGAFMGRSRVATLPAAREGRDACGYLGRCLWGCPRGALYTPSMTLSDCRSSPRFTYHGGWRVEAFSFDERRAVTSVSARSVADGTERTFPVRRLALAAGTLNTARIYLESWRRGTGETLALDGLMDNRQVLAPFVTVRRIGSRYDERSYQYHQLSIGLSGDDPREYVHGQVTTLTTAQAHPVIQSVPLDLRTAGYVFRSARAALGMVNLNFHDTRRSDCLVRAGPAPGSIEIEYRPPAGEKERLEAAVRRLRKVLRTLGSFVVGPTVHVRPMGASVHYAGLLPMSTGRTPHATTEGGASQEFENLWIVDGSGFPFLPAKNLTFTLMANATRIAHESF